MNNHPTNTQSFEEQVRDILEEAISVSIKQIGRLVNESVNDVKPKVDKELEYAIAAITSAHRTDMAAYQAQLLADYEDDVKQRETQARIEELENWRIFLGADKVIKGEIDDRIEQLKKGQS